MSEQWFTAKCIYVSEHSGIEPPHEILREHRYFLVSGQDEVEAERKVHRIAIEREHSYVNEFGATVTWKLECTQDVKEIFDFELRDGLEVYHEYIGGS